MALFASNGTIEKDCSSPVETVGTAIESVAREQGHHLATISQDRGRYELTTQRSAMSWGVALAITLSSSDSGTRMVLDYDNAPGSPRALLDGRKKARIATKFVDQLEARL